MYSRVFFITILISVIGGSMLGFFITYSFMNPSLHSIQNQINKQKSEFESLNTTLHNMNSLYLQLFMSIDDDIQTMKNDSVLIFKEMNSLISRLKNDLNELNLTVNYLIDLIVNNE